MYFRSAALILPLLVSICSAWPSQKLDGSRLGARLVKRVLTPDNTCGGTNGYTCDPTQADGGSCCSAAGYCGNSTDYCGTGCQSAYGTCTVSTTTDPDDTDLCGPSNDGMICGDGQCCSVYGYCGTTDDYCSADNCLTGYGNCTATGSGTTNTDGGQCGPDANGASCPSGQCCSAAGWCGTGTEHCADPDCQYLYGTCDSDTTPAGSRTDGVHRPLVGDVTYADDIYDCFGDNIVGLSYDDGPYEYTSELLDLLDQYGFKATFFITGNNLGKGPIDTTAPYPDLIQRMTSSGHQVASHTWSHYSLQNISQSKRIDQMVKNEMAFVNIIGKYPTYMRPPYSQCDEASGCWADIQALGYHRILFDLDSQDYLNPLPSQIQNSKNIVNAALNVAGVSDYLSIQHDIVQQSVTNLTSYYYSLIQAKGWKGVTVGTCLGDPEENWYRQVDGSSGAAAQVSSSSVSSRISSTSATSATSASTVQESTAEVTASETSSSAVVNPETSEATSSDQTKATSSATKASSVTAPTTLTSNVVPSNTDKSSSALLPTTTTKASSTSKSSISSSTSSTPSPASPCIYQAGSFCGTLKSFSNSPTCLLAVADCDVQLLTCPLKAGLWNVGTCSAYRKTCSSLSTYCLRCAHSKGGCSKENFLS